MAFFLSLYGENIYNSITTKPGKPEEEVINSKPPIAAEESKAERALTMPVAKKEALPKKDSPKPLPDKVKKPLSPIERKKVKRKPVKKYPPLGEFDFYTVVKGDTLWDIADAYTNNPYDYHLVAEGNRVINPDLIEPGLRLRLKKKWKGKNKK